ncbi:MAG: Sphingolipid (R)-alpha-hydroxylase FAH1 (no EC), partial [uncultured Solirubrobacteraceae bacterium]
GDARSSCTAGPQAHGRAAGLPAHVRLAAAGPLHPRAPRRRAGPVRARHRRLRRPGAGRAGARHRPGARRGGLRPVDADGVLAAPRGLPLRAGGRDRRAAALDDPRGPPRPSQRPDAPRDAAGRVRAARDGLRAALPGPAPVRRGVRGERRLLRGLPGLRHDALLRPPSPPADVGGAQAARAAHAPSLPGPQRGLRGLRPVVGRRLPHRAALQAPL